MPKSVTRKRKSQSNGSFQYRRTNEDDLSETDLPVVIGEGTYGCVVNPSLRCEEGDEPTTYQNTVSKIMDRGDAADEYDEMKKIHSIQGIDRYVLKMPHKCVPDLSRNFEMTVRQCKGKRVVRNFNTPHRYKLMIMEDGGADLHIMLKTVIPKMNFPDICRFLTAFRELIEGLLFFRNNRIIHHDIKMENIVYNVRTGLIKYIDFGLMMWRNEFITRSKNNSNSQGISWFNFPGESKCANKSTFVSDKVCATYRATMSYDAFIKKSVDTFDLYSLALVIYDMAKALQDVPEFKRTVDSKVFCEELKRIVSPFFDNDLRERLDNIHTLHVEYDALLRKYKLVNESKPTPTPGSVYLNACISFSFCWLERALISLTWQ